MGRMAMASGVTIPGWSLVSVECSVFLQCLSLHHVNPAVMMVVMMMMMMMMTLETAGD